MATIGAARKCLPTIDRIDGNVAAAAGAALRAKLGIGQKRVDRDVLRRVTHCVLDQHRQQPGERSTRAAPHRIAGSVLSTSSLM